MTQPWIYVLLRLPNTNSFGINRVNECSIMNNAAPVQPLIKDASNEGSLIDTRGLASHLTCINYDNHMMRLMTGSHAGIWQGVTARPPSPLLVWTTPRENDNTRFIQSHTVDVYRIRDGWTVRLKCLKLSYFYVIIFFVLVISSVQYLITNHTSHAYIFTKKNYN